ncbi:hypothetical protein BLNAU_18956 [Blattamonas nauphoetae]|uniref:Uncharacterized protein n=1 Tax=Blattamonas nauphoetae TaxID=2049346 RepID=A0ABQ9X2W7_9EUKA|nr:hypothetical protein BLNAU_18956 [Blattamonas nauphoetae]
MTYNIPTVCSKDECKNACYQCGGKAELSCPPNTCNDCRKAWNGKCLTCKNHRRGSTAARLCNKCKNKKKMHVCCLCKKNYLQRKAGVMPFFTECLSQLKIGDGQTKMEIVLSVHSTILSDEQRVGEMSAPTLRLSLFFLTLSLEIVLLRSLVVFDVAGMCDECGVIGCEWRIAACPDSSELSSSFPRWSDLSVSPLFFSSLTSSLFCDDYCVMIVPDFCDCLSSNGTQKSENGVGEAASHAIGHLCSVCLSSNDVEGILNCGIVEGLCSQCLTLISTWNGSESWTNRTMSLVGGLDRLCTGLSEFISSENKRSESKQRMLNDQQEEALGDEEESRRSLLADSSSALSLIESTLGEMLAELFRQKHSVKLDQHRKALRKEVTDVLMEHFPHTIVPRREKPDGMIGLDIGKEKQRMEEQLRMKMREMEEKDHLRETEREREREEMKKKEDERREELDKKLEELNTMKLSMEAERAKNQQMMEQARRWAEQERNRQPRMGAEAIELFDKTNWTLFGNVFTKSKKSDASLVSFEFGEVVARLFLTIRKGPHSNFAVGIISSNLSRISPSDYFPNLKGGAGWDVHPLLRSARQNGKEKNRVSACEGGRKGQRVVLEADGRDGRRTLKLSQDGETQPVFFTNIPVPFRFAVWIYNEHDAVEIESVDVVSEPQMVGGTTPAEMDE